MDGVRKDGCELPIVFMMYYNTVLHYGLEAFAEKCAKVGVDGLIIPDLPLEEQEELQTQLQKEDGTILIQLVSPVSKDRVPKILKNARYLNMNSYFPCSFISFISNYFNIYQLITVLFSKP